MSDQEEQVWWQGFFLCMIVPGLLEVPERWAIVTFFSTNKENPLSGHVRFYTFHSFEQADDELRERRNYEVENDFFPYLGQVVKNGSLPNNNFAGLPDMEMTEDTQLARLAVMVINDMIRIRQKAAAKQAETAGLWQNGEKAKA